MRLGYRRAVSFLSAAVLFTINSVPSLSDDNLAVPGSAFSPQVSSEYEDYVPRMVFFPSALPPPPSPFQRKIAEKKGLPLEAAAATQVLGRLYLPEGEGPFPAVVLLPGATGIWDWDDVWAQRLRGWGYVVLNVDSLSPRGLYRHNLGSGETDSGLRRRFLGAFPRALDALGAADYLAGQPYVAAASIAAIGAAEGGAAVMQALAKENPRNAGQFRAGVALYAPCDALSGVTAPLLVLQGAEDQWISVKRCMQNFGALAAAGSVELVIYPDAYHQFDYDSPDREMAGRPLRYSSTAARDAEKRIKDFLRQEMGSAG